MRGARTWQFSNLLYSANFLSSWRTLPQYMSLCLSAGMSTDEAILSLNCLTVICKINIPWILNRACISNYYSIRCLKSFPGTAKVKARTNKQESEYKISDVKQHNTHVIWNRISPILGIKRLDCNIDHLVWCCFLQRTCGKTLKKDLYESKYF